MLTSLVRNAIRYTPRDGSIKIESCYLMHVRQVQIKVEDSGLGIELGEIDKIFSAKQSQGLAIS